MYNNTFRSCCNIIGKHCSNFIISPSRHKINASRFTLSTKRHCVSGYVLINRNYSTDNSNIKTLPQQNKNAQIEHNDINNEMLEEGVEGNSNPTSVKQLPPLDCTAQEKLDDLSKRPEYEKQLQVLKLEIEVYRYDAEKVPDYIRPRDWLSLLYMKTKSQRRRHLEFLWRNEKKGENMKLKKEIKKLENVESMEQLNAGALEYGLGRNSMFIRIYPTTINQFYHSRLMRAMIFEPIVVYDLGYCHHMSNLENTNCAKQVVLSFVANRQHVNPFNLYFCNADKSSNLMQSIERILPTIYNTDFPLNVTSESYLDLFDPKKLVYLTPHCNNELTEYDPDMIYIVGGMVDKTNPQPLSLAKAKREGIKMAKFPLERYLKWKGGSGKNLTLNQVMNILLDVRHTKDWQTALRHVPVRKIKRDIQNYDSRRGNQAKNFRITKSRENFE